MEKKTANFNVSFSITLNDHVIIERLFNVSRYNKNVKFSNNWTSYMDELKDWLEHSLVIKASNYLSENKDEIINNWISLKRNNEKEEYFNIYVKHDDVVIGHRQINASLFPSAVRYNLDIRPFDKGIKDELISLLSKHKGLDYEYLGYDLLTH